MIKDRRLRGRYPYRRGCTRGWCRVCDKPRFVRLQLQRDAWVCLTCGAKTNGIQVTLLYSANIVSWDGRNWYHADDVPTSPHDIRLTYGVSA